MFKEVVCSLLHPPGLHHTLSNLCTLCIFHTVCFLCVNPLRHRQEAEPRPKHTHWPTNWPTAGWIKPKFSWVQFIQAHCWLQYSRNLPSSFQHTSFFSRLHRELNGAPSLRLHYKLGPNVLRITKLWNSQNLPLVLVPPAPDEVHLKRRCAQSTISIPQVKYKQTLRTLHLANQKKWRRSARSKSQPDEGEQKEEVASVKTRRRCATRR